MIEFLKREWSEKAENFLGETLRNDRDAIKSEVDNSISDLCEITGKGWCVIRSENKELVIVAMVAIEGVDIVNYISDYAQKNGYLSIRFHSKRKGMHVLAKRVKFEYYETVYKRVF